MTPRLLAPPPDGPVEPRPGLPSFSVVIPAFNAAALVADAVRSVLEQTLSPAEVLVVDDGSSDGTAGALAPFGSAVTVVRQEHGGAAAARNLGVSLAAGEYVVLLDADDWWLPERLERLGEAAAQRPDLAVITTDAWVDRAGAARLRYTRDCVAFETADQRRAILWHNFVFGHAALPRAAWLAAGGMPAGQRIGEDWQLWRRVILDGGRAGMVDEPLAVYRRWPGEATSATGAVLSARVATLAESLSDASLTREERRVVRSRLAAERLRLARVPTVPGRLARRRVLDVLLDVHRPADLREGPNTGTSLARLSATAWAAAALVAPRRMADP